MKRLTQRMVQYFEGVPDQLAKRKLLVWLFFILTTVFFAVGMGRAKFDASIEGWFDKEDPLIVAFDWFHHEFGSDDHLYIVYRPKDGDVFSAQSLQTLLKMQQELQSRVAGVREGDGSAFKHVVKITSLINAPVLHAENGALISKKLVGTQVPATPEGLAKIREVAQSQKSFPLLYFSKNHEYGGMLIETDFGAIPLDSPAQGESSGSGQAAMGELKLEAPTQEAAQERPKFKPTDLADYVALMDEVKAVIEKPEYASQFTYYPVGSTAAAEYNVDMITEMGMLNLAALVIMILLLWFIFRSLSAVLWPVVITVMTVVWTVGITAWLGLPITSFVMVTIMLTLAVGIADTVHMMSAYMSARRAGDEHPAAMRHAFRHVSVAMLLTTITNIVAVVALSLTPIVPMQVFTLMCCLGVGLPFVFSIYLLPLMLTLWAPKVRQKRESRVDTWAGRLIPDVATHLGSLLKRVLPLVERRASLIFGLFMTLFAVCIYGATLTKVNTDPVASFPEEWKIRQSVRVVDQNMMGAQSMEIYLDLGKENAFHDPFVLRTVDQLQRTIEREHPDIVVRATSLVDTVKDSYKTLHEGKEDMYVIPATRDAVSQTLFLFNQSSPDDRRRLVSDNYDKSRISVRLYNRGSYEYTQAWDGMRADIEESVAEIKKQYPDAKVSITGMLPLMMQGADYLTNNELQSFTVAIVLVSLMLLVLFGSLKGGAIALVPNLIPAFLAYGVLGLLGEPLDITTMMIAPIIIGIAVDDTVHFMTHYRAEVVVDGDIRRALQATISQTGLSVIFTAAILGLGFGVMAFASDAGVRNLGVFGFLSIFVGLLNDLFLLPAMILLFKLKFPQLQASPPASAAPELSASGQDA